MKTILIAGASGYLGRHAVTAFKQRGYRVRVLVRNPDKLADLQAYIDDTVLGEITRPDTLTGCCDGVDAVFSAVGITRQKDGLTYRDVDYQGNVNLLNAAKRAGVTQFLYISVLHADQLAHLQGVRAKLDFENCLKAAGLDYTIVRPNGFFSDMGEFLEMAKRGRGYLFGTGNYRLNPIHGADLAEFCVDALESEQQLFSIGGPHTYTHREIMALAFSAINKPVKITCLPLWLRDWVLFISRRLTSVKIYGPLEFMLTVLSRDLEGQAVGSRSLEAYFREMIPKVPAL